MAAKQFSGTGSPNGVVFGDPGDVYQDENGAFWFKVSGAATNNGWVAASAANAMALPALWRQDNVPAATGPSPLPISGSNFSDLVMIRDGSIVGLRARLTQAVTADDLTVEITKNGVGTGISVNLGVGSDGDFQTNAIGGVTYVQGDTIGVQFTSSVGFTPTTTDLEAWVEVVEVAI